MPENSINTNLPQIKCFNCEGEYNAEDNCFVEIAKSKQNAFSVEISVCPDCFDFVARCVENFTQGNERLINDAVKRLGEKILETLKREGKV